MFCHIEMAFYEEDDGKMAKGKEQFWIDQTA